MDFLKNSKNALKKAVKTINNGGVIVFPTDTVYGFLAKAESKKAIEKIYKLKKRLRSKPLPVFVRDIKMARELAEIDKKQEAVLKKHWPGKYTFILKAKIKSPKLLIKNKKIALRIPKYRSLNDLLKKINKPLAQTSVNISGKPPMFKIEEIKKTFGSDPNLGLIVSNGNLKKSKPSVIIDLTDNKIKFLRK